MEGLELKFAALFGGFHFEIDQGKAGLGGGGQDVQFLDASSGKASTKLLAAASGDGDYLAVGFEKSGDGGDRGCGFGAAVVE